MTMTKQELLADLAADQDIQTILHIIHQLQLPDAWLCAGTIRNFIWNRLSEKSGFDGDTDVDVIFYDQTLSPDETVRIEEQLKQAYPTYSWELKNQAAMHRHSPHTLPYTSSQDAMSKYPETFTAIGLRLDDKGKMELYCPYGLASILSFEVRPTPHFLEDTERMKVYRTRLAKKDWAQKWPQLQFFQE